MGGLPIANKASTGTLALLWGSVDDSSQRLGKNTSEKAILNRLRRKTSILTIMMIA
jgi:hypothetical protein